MMPDEAIKLPVPGKDRVAKHRAREKERNLQVAVAAARLVIGENAGDQGKALLAFIKKVSKRNDLPEDYQNLLDRAVDSLSARRRR